MGAIAEAIQETDFQDTPEGWAQRWKMELDAGRRELEKWHSQGERIVKRFLDERESSQSGDTRWNLFTANVEIKQATLYGQTPKVSVTRRFADSKDDVARVAAEMLERLLNTDIEKDGDCFAIALEQALEDRLLPGMGLVRVRYEAGFEDVAETPARVDEETGAERAPAVPASHKKTYECVETDYVHWKDVLWSPSRTWQEVRWLAFRAQMSRDELVKRFGEKAGKAVPLNAKRAISNKDDDTAKADPWGRADVWEVWSKEHCQVFWFVDGYPAVLDQKDDPYELDGFWPCPRPMFAFTTTSKLVPRPEFVIAQDLYDEIDLVSTRVTLLERAIRVAGVYDKSSSELKRLLSETAKNELIPVDNWAMFAEKGGIKGVVDWLPLEQIVTALTSLRDYRRELIEALNQITGMSDILRGQAAEGGATATEQGIKARFGSVRLQRMQDELARFASDAQKLKSELISKLFEPETIYELSNARYTLDDQNLAMAAIQLIKSDLACYRIEVKPEAVSLTDFAALKAERMEVLGGITAFVQAIAPLAQQMPGAMPYFLQMLQWAVSGLKGSSQIEGVLDQAITAVQQMQKQAAAQPQMQQPDPKLIAAQAKAAADEKKIQLQTQADLVHMQAETQAIQQRQQFASQTKVQEQVAVQRIKQAMTPAPSGGPRGPGGGRP